MNDKLSQAVSLLGKDISSAVRFSPLGDAIIRSLYAVNKVGPNPLDQASYLPGAIRAASTGLMPGAVGAGAVGGGLMQMAQNALGGNSATDNVIPATIEGARSASLLAPLLPIAQSINAPQLRLVPRDGGLPKYEMQTLIQNALQRLR